MALSPILLALTLVAQDPLAVDTMRPEGGPRITLHRQATPLVALRLDAPVDPSLPEGAIELLQELARPAAETEAERLGARLSLRLDGGTAVIAVTGPAVAFDALAAILRRATTPNDLSVAALRAARARAEDRVLARLERPHPRVRSLLRHALAGRPIPEGAAATLLEPEGVRAISRSVYHPEAIRVTVVGGVPDPVLRSAFARWTTSQPGPQGDTVTVPDGSPEAARPQAHREWAGLAYPVAADPAVLAVAAELVRRRIERSALRSGSIEWWRTAEGLALVLVGATEPDDDVVRTAARISALPVREAGPGEEATGVGRYLRRMVAEAAALAGPGSVEEARSRVRWELLLEARTVTGKADVIGRYQADLGDPRGAAALLAAVGAVQLDDVRSLLQEVLSARAYYAEAR